MTKSGPSLDVRQCRGPMEDRQVEMEIPTKGYKTNDRYHLSMKNNRIDMLKRIVNKKQRDKTPTFDRVKET